MPRGYTRASLGIIWAWDIQLDLDCRAMYHFRRPLRRGYLMTNRREFLRGTAATAFSLAAPADLFAQAAMAAPASSTWDSGAVRHLLPTVSDRRLLIKTSFNTPLSVAPTLRVDGTSVRGRMSDTRGEHWHFHATDLKPGRPHQLSLVGDKGRALCEPWQLATFPGPDEQPKQFRVLFFSCAGGHEAMKYLPPAVRMRLFRRAFELSATGRRRQWRSYILGFAFTADCEAAGRVPVGRADRWQVRPRRGGARR